jgi:hypothetical protein
MMERRRRRIRMIIEERKEFPRVEARIAQG